MSDHFRVVQWATGNIGLKSLRGVIEHPAMTLVGLYVYGPDKVGQDAGELCGLDAVGVPATGSIEDVVAADADCVLYMPRMLDVDDVCLLLESGTNVVTTCGQFHHPPSMDPATRTRIEAACTAGGTSIHSTGSSPGFISEAVPLVLTSIQRRLDKLDIYEYADLSKRDSPELLFDIMGFGRELAPFHQARADHLRSSFGPSLRLVADAVGLPLDDVTAKGELAATPRETDIAAGTLKAGTVAAQRITVSGIRAGHELITFRANWYCTTDLEPVWELREGPRGPRGGRGAGPAPPPLDVELRMPVPLDQMAETSPGYTANRAVNLVAAVCAAPPGIRSTLDLPHALARLS
jgi:4-hydroxy-tetrahydrodipicolinate reductase